MEDNEVKISMDFKVTKEFDFKAFFQVLHDNGVNFGLKFYSEETGDKLLGIVHPQVTKGDDS